jgi:HEAT repeat protein
MTFAERIRSIFNLRADEGRIVSRLVLFSFFQSMAIAIFSTAANALFLSEYSVDSLPYVYIISSLFIAGVSVWYTHLENRFPPLRVMFYKVVFLLLSAVVFYFSLNASFSVWIVFGLMVWYRLMTVLVSADYVRSTSLLFDVRQSKRIFTLLSSSDIPARMIGFLLVSVLVPYIETHNLLWLFVFFFALSLLFLSDLIPESTNQSISEVALPAQESITGDKKGIITKLFKNNFIFLLSLVSFLSIFVLLCTDFAFLTQVSNKFDSQTQIAYFLGILFGTGQLITLFLKTFLYTRIIRHLGTRAALIFLPILLCALFFFSALFELLSLESNFQIWIWIAIMFISDIVRSFLYNTTFLTLLQPLQSKLRLAGHDILTWIEIITIGCSGLFLLALINFNLLNLSLLAILLIPITLVWVGFIILIKKEYIRTLEKALKYRLLEGSELVLTDTASIDLLKRKLFSTNAGEVLYALKLMTKTDNKFLFTALSSLLHHPVPAIRMEVLKKVEEFKLTSFEQSVRVRIEEEALSSIKDQAIRTYCALGEATVVDEVSKHMDSSDNLIKKGAIVGLIQYGGINGLKLAGDKIMLLTASENASERELAAQIIGQVNIGNFYHPLLTLLKDEEEKVKIAAIEASGKIKNPRLYPYLFSYLSYPALTEASSRALITIGEAAIGEIEKEFIVNCINATKLRKLSHICGRIGGEKSIELLKKYISIRDTDVRNQVLASLALCGYQCKADEVPMVLKAIDYELNDAAWFLSCLANIFNMVPPSQIGHLREMEKAFSIEINQAKKRIMFLLSYIYEAKTILKAKDNYFLNSSEKKANAIEILDVVTSQELTAKMLPLLEDFSLPNQIKLLNTFYPQKQLSFQEYLQHVLAEKNVPDINPWTYAVILLLIRKLKLKELIPIVYQSILNPYPLIVETALWTLMDLEPMLYERYLEDYKGEQLPSIKKIMETIEQRTMNTKLLIIEKVMILKTTDIFSETSEEILVDIASILIEEQVKAGDTVVNKGETGTCMYIIYEGKVRVFDGDHTFAHLGSRDFFGELSLLDAEPRSASVAAIEDTFLLRLDQHTFFEILADRIEVTREILKILCRRLRSQNQAVADLQLKLMGSNTMI